MVLTDIVRYGAIFLKFPFSSVSDPFHFVTGPFLGITDPDSAPNILFFLSKIYFSRKRYVLFFMM